VKINGYGSVKTRLITQYLLFIILFALINLSVLLVLRIYNRNVFNLFDRLNNTVSIAFRLGESHQHISDYINYYMEPPYEEQFLESIEELGHFLSSLDPQIRQAARVSNEINYYYQFLDIQEMILTYMDKGKILLARAKSGTKRAVLYDHLYELKDYKTRIYEESSDLLFRQTVLIRETVERIGNLLFMITILITAGTLLTTAILIFLAVRMADKITSPLHYLVLQAENAARGDFRPKKVDVQADTEIQILIDAFNNMMDNTGSLISELEKKAELERLLNKAEIQALNAQINPHFLFNTLNAISSLAMIEEAEKTGEMIESLAEILRYYLQAGREEIRFGEEIRLIEKYLMIQKTRFGSRLETEIRVEESCRERMIPPMLLQPLVENAVKHGLEPKEDTGHLSVRAAVTGGFMELTVKDDGVGIPRSEQERLLRGAGTPTPAEGHIGLKNVMRRMELLAGKETFTFESEPGRTVFSLKFPLRPDGTAEGSCSGAS